MAVVAVLDATLKGVYVDKDLRCTTILEIILPQDSFARLRAISPRSLLLRRTEQVFGQVFQMVARIERVSVRSFSSPLYLENIINRLRCLLSVG